MNVQKWISVQARWRTNWTAISLLALSFLLFSFSARANCQIVVAKAPPRLLHIQVNANEPAGSAIPRTIFGSFLEPIGNSIQGGVSAQILVNPSFEVGLWSYPHVQKMISAHPALARSTQLGLPLPWEPLDWPAGSRYALHYGNAANSWTSLEVMGSSGEPVGIKQEIYLPSRRTLHYSVSLYAAHLSGPSQITIQFMSTTGKSLAEALIDARDKSWHKYDAALTLQPGALHRLEPAYFVLKIEDNERVKLDQFSLMPSDAIDGLDPDVVAFAKRMHVSLLRFGGNFTSVYGWRDGIGPTDKRVSIRNLAWGIPQYNLFGTDEFLKFCELIGAEPQIDLNMGTGTPEEAADWVRYIRAHYSGKVLWELGNELWGSYQAGAPSFQQAAPRTLDFSKAVSSADPGAVMIATGERPHNYQAWNAALLRLPAGSFDYLSTHFIRTTNQVNLQNPTPNFLAESAFALPVEAGRRFEQMQAQINQAPGFAHKAHLALTEWLFASRGAGFRVFLNDSPNFNNMGGAVITAGMFNTLIRNADIVPISNMTGILEFAGIWKRRGQVYGTPSYYAFQMYSTADIDHTVHATTDSGSYSVHNGIPGYADIPDVPYLDVVAATSKDRDSLTLFCVNRDVSRDLDARISLTGFDAAPEATVESLEADNIYEGNSAVDPLLVKPVTRKSGVSGPELRYTFPQSSVTVITFHRK